MIGNTPFLACRTLFPSQLWECEKAQLAPSVDFYKEKITGIQEALQNERWQMGLSEKRVPQNRMFYHHLLYETIWGVSPTSKPTWEIGTPWCFVPCCHDSHKFHPVIWHVCNAHMQCAKYAMHIYILYIYIYMCVCMCIYIYIYIYVCICVCIYIYVWVVKIDIICHVFVSRVYSYTYEWTYFHAAAYIFHAGSIRFIHLRSPRFRTCLLSIYLISPQHT